MNEKREGDMEEAGIEVIGEIGMKRNSEEAIERVKEKREDTEEAIEKTEDTVEAEEDTEMVIVKNGRDTAEEVAEVEEEIEIGEATSM